jgi:hypothetical protein
MGYSKTEMKQFGLVEFELLTAARVLYFIGT